MLLCPWEKHFAIISSAWKINKQYQITVIRISITKKNSVSNISASPKAGQGNRFPENSTSVAFLRVRRINREYNTNIQRLIQTVTLCHLWFLVYRKNFLVPFICCIVLYCIVFSIYPPDLQESDRGAIHREAITPTCFRRYRDIAVRLIFFFFFLIEWRMTVIWNCLLIRQAEKIIAKCLSQRHNNMTTAGFEPRPYRSKTVRVTINIDDQRPCWPYLNQNMQ